jgi:SAM-dependent methyltransferase
VDVANVEFWESIYAAGTPPWDQAAPAPPLVRVIEETELPPHARVFVPGCGFGHEALWLAAHDYHVTAVDFAPAAIEGLRYRAQAAGVAIDVIEADVFDLPTELGGGFDALVEHTCFCAIDPHRRHDYARIAAQLLGHAGVLLGLFFEVAGTIEEGPPFPTTRSDIIRHFEPAFEINRIEQPEDSFSRRQGREWLASMRRREI